MANDKWRRYSDRFLVVRVGEQASMTAPMPGLEWALRYGGDQEKVRMVAASAVESYRYLVKSCSQKEAWRRLKLIREAMKAAQEEAPDGD